MQEKEREVIFTHTMEALDKRFDSQAAMLGNSVRGHGVRDSAHYALGLLVRGQGADAAHAARVIEAILDQQLGEDEGQVYYGTFKRSDREPDPVDAPFPGEHFDASARYWLDVWQEKIGDGLRAGLIKEGFTPEQRAVIATQLRKAVLGTIPVIWESYDPNWRVFIATTFTLIFEKGAHLLPDTLLERMRTSMERAVTGSITRYERNIHPMNTNVELMHIYVCDYYGALLGRDDFTQHALYAARAFLADHSEYGTVAEFNSPTYYGVDFTCLAMGRQYAPSGEIRDFCAQMENALWNEVSEYYHPGLGNICGPFSRSYELDIRIHTNFPSLLYLLLGEGNAQRPGVNSELADGIDLSLVGACASDAVVEKLRAFYGPHAVERRYKELIERGAPDANRPVCTATSYLHETYMLGALRGSKNTSGQLRPANAFWRTPEGVCAYMTLLRRAVGDDCAHYRTVLLDAQVLDENRMDIDVTFDVARDIELFFEIGCPGAEETQIAPDAYHLPGMCVQVSTDAPVPQVCKTKTGLEVVYLHKAEDTNTMHFTLTFEKTQG